jgi:hypothetical protein
MPATHRNPCPRCLRPQAFDVFWVDRSSYDAHCRFCRYFKRHRHPQIKKSIICLDQNVLSNLSALVDPRFPAIRRQRLPTTWKDLLIALIEAVHNQIIVCPTDEIHERESNLFQYGAATLALAKRLSNNIRFQFGFRIISQQLAIAASSWFLGHGARLPDYSRVKAFHEPPHGWSRWFEISIEGMFPPLHTPEQLRAERERMHNVLMPIYNGWRSNPRDFEVVRTEEMAAFGPSVLRRTIKDVGAAKMDPALVFGTVAIHYVQTVQHALLRLRCRADSLLDTMIDFFTSDAAAKTPSNQIRSVLFGHEAHQIKHGMRHPRSSMLNDIDRFTAVLPYCDAALVENHFAEALQSRRRWLPQEARRCTVFGVRQIHGFLQYLAQLRSNFPLSHFARVRYIYGPARAPSILD